DPIPPSHIDPEIPKWADAIVLKAMAKDPFQRYQSAAEMRADIQRVLSGLPVDPQTMALATSYQQYGGAADRTRTMTATDVPSVQATQAIPDYEYSPPERNGRYDRRRGGGNTALKTALWIVIPLLILGAFIGNGYAFLSPGSSGTTKVKVPQLVNQTKEAAEKALTDLGLKVAYGPAEYHDEVPKNSVIRTEPAADTEVSLGDTVTVILSKGRELVSIPTDIIGKTPEEAKAELEALGLNVSIVMKTAPGKPQGKVYDTNPKPGQRVAKDTLVRLYVPRELAQVPSVVGIP